MSFQQTPIIVDVGPKDETAADISIDFIIGMFAMAGVLLLLALVGGLIVGGVILLCKRRREAKDSGESSHTRLRIQGP
jgi:hypothetical protein